MLNLIRTDADHPDFVRLVAALDAHLAVTDEDEHDFYDQFNKLDAIRHVLVGYADGVAVACGAFKPFDQGTVEIKRMYTAPNYRGRGLAAELLDGLEAWARAEGYGRAVLETGKRQPYAIRLYEKQGYGRMADNYGPYVGMDNSVCMEKSLTDGQP